MTDPRQISTRVHLRCDRDLAVMTHDANTGKLLQVKHDAAPKPTRGATIINPQKFATSLAELEANERVIAQQIKDIERQWNADCRFYLFCGMAIGAVLMAAAVGLTVLVAGMVK